MSATDLATIEQRLISNSLASPPSSTTVATYQSTIQTDGTWADIDYTSTAQTNWAPNTHLDRLRLMSRAYVYPSGSLYQNATLLSDILLAYDAWITLDPQSSNWWYNQISVPQFLGEIMVLIKAQLSTTRTTSGLAIVQRAYVARSTNSGTNTGLNRVDRAIAGISRGIVSASDAITSDAFLAISDTIVVTTAEGIQRDGSFQQHGAQLYNQGYGSGFISSVLKWASLAAGTSYDFGETKAHILIDYLLDGTRWMNRGQVIDYTASGRGLSRKNQSTTAAGLGSLANTAITIAPTYRTTELNNLNASISAANSTGSADPLLSHTGAKHFWRSDLTTWHIPGCYAGVKISSTRTLQPESGNGEGLKNLHLADGVNLIMRSGNEYDDIMPVWNWRKLPGTTIEQGTYSLKPSSDWGVAGTSTFAGGISDGSHAASTIKYNRRNVAAKKSWFFFDQEFIALGTEINASAATNQVETTLNQSLQNGSVTYSTGGTPITLASGTLTTAGLEWAHHDSTGYFFNQIPSSSTIKAAAQTGTWQSINTGYDATTVSDDVFTLSIRHGTGFTGGSYAYTVVPGLTASDMPTYVNPLTILRNDSTVQAVRHATSEVTQATFYAANSLSITTDRTLTADSPSLVILRGGNGGLHLSTSSPEAKTMTLGVQFTALPLPGWLSAFGANTAATLGLPGGDLAGSTCGLDVTSDGAADPTLTISGNGGFTNLDCTFNSPVALPGNTTLLSDSATLAITGPISGTATFTKSGTSTLSLTGNNTYTGATTASGGILNLSNDPSAATGGWLIGPTATATTTVNFLPGSTVVSTALIRIGNTTSTGTKYQTLNVAGSVTNQAELYLGRPGILNLTTGGNWTQHGPASLNAHGGYPTTLTLNSGTSFTYDGSTNFIINPSPSGGGPATLTIDAATLTTARGFTNNIASSTAAANIILENAGTLTLSDHIPDLATTAGSPLLIQLGTGGGKINTNGFDATLNLPLTDAGTASGTLTKTGSGTLTLTAPSTYTGGTTIPSGGGTLLITHPAALGTGPISITKGGTATGTLALALTGSNTLTNTFNGFNSTTFSGDSTLPTIHHLSGETTLTSDLTITGLGGNGLYLRSDSGLLTLTGTIQQTVGSTRNLGLGGTGDGLITGPILTATGGLGLVKNGTGTWTLTGANTYNNRTTINAGTLRIGDGGTTGTPGSAEISIKATARLELHRSDPLTLTNTLTGAGDIVQSGTGHTTLSSATLPTGNTYVTAGTLTLSANALADTSLVEISTAATLDLTHAQTDTISTLTFDGIPQASGTWGAPGSAATHTSPRLSGTGMLLVLTGPYQLWTAAHNLTAADAALTADPDADGTSNLIEYALATDPTAFTPTPTFTHVSGTSTYIFTQNLMASDITILPEWSNDLTTWHSENFTFTTLGETNGVRTLQLTLPLDNSTRRFIHLKIECPDLSP